VNVELIEVRFLAQKLKPVLLQIKLYHLQMGTSHAHCHRC